MFGSGHAGEVTPIGCLGKPLISTKRAEGRGKREGGLRELKISIHFCRCHPEQQKYSHICVITAPLRGICTKRKLHFMFDLKQTMRLQACLFPVESALLMCLLLRLGVNLSFLTSVSRGPPMMHTTVSLTLCLLSVLLFVFFFSCFLLSVALHVRNGMFLICGWPNQCAQCLFIVPQCFSLHSPLTQTGWSRHPLSLSLTLSGIKSFPTFDKNC